MADVSHETDRSPRDRNQIDAESLELGPKTTLDTFLIGNELLATISHEMRSPLGVITGWLDILRQGGIPIEQNQGIYETMTRNAMEILSLLNDLQEMADLGLGHAKLKWEIFNLNESILRAIERVRTDSRKHRISFTSSQDAFTNGDRSLLDRMFSKVLTNVIKFSSPNSEIQVDASVEDQTYYVEISDPGSIFDPAAFCLLFQGKVGDSPSGSGRLNTVGSTLAIAKYFAKIHGGDLGANYSSQGNGVLFWVKLPVTERK